MNNTERLGLSLRYPLHFLGWLWHAPKPALWSAATIVINLGAAGHAWFGAKDDAQFHENMVRGLGAGLQCAGVIAVCWGIFQTRRLFESHGAPAPMREWLSRRPSLWHRRRNVTVEPITGSLSITLGDLTMRATGSTANTTIEEQLANLRLAVEGLQTITADLRSEMIAGDETTKATLKTALAAETAALANQIAQARQLLVSHATGGLNLSVNGAISLFVGVLLGTLPYSWF